MPEQPFTVQRYRGGFAMVWHAADGRHRYRLESTDRPSAEAEARKRWDDGDKSPWTVGRVISGYLTAKEAEGIASIARRKDAWKAMKPFWENVNPAVIDEQMCRDYLARRGVSGVTVRLELQMLSTALARVKADVPATYKIWLPPAGERKTRHLTVRQFKRLLAGTAAPHAKLYMLLGVFTLARPSALFELKWSQVNFITNMIDLNPPGRRQTVKKRPVVPMNDMLREAMAEAFKARTCENVIERGGKQIASIKKAFQRAEERSGVKATPYTLRHTGAVWAAENGVPMPELAQMMGHDDDSTTQRHYARFSPGHLRGVVNAVQDAYENEVEVHAEPPAPVSLRRKGQ